MGSRDQQHRLRQRADRTLALLRQLWGDALPPGTDPELTVVLDALAYDEEDARAEHVVSRGDGLTYEVIANLVRRSTPSPNPTSAVVVAPQPSPAGDETLDERTGLPPRLADHLRSLGLLPDAVEVPPEDVPSGSAGPPNPSQPHAAGTQTGVWEFDPVTGVVNYDDVSARLIGVEPMEGGVPLDSRIPTLIHPDDCRTVASKMHESLTSGAPYVVRFRTLTADGGTAWFISHGRVLRHRTDAPPRLTGFLTADTDGSRVGSSAPEP